MKKVLVILLTILATAALLTISPIGQAAYVGYGNLDYFSKGDATEGNRWGHIVSSLVVTGTVILYDDVDFKSSANTIPFSNTQVPDLSTKGRGSWPGNWDNMVRSLKVDGTVALYEHPNYGGRRLTFTSGSLPYENIGTEWNRNSLLTKNADPSTRAWDTRMWHWDIIAGVNDIFHGDSNNYVNWNYNGQVDSRANDGYGDPYKASNFDQGYERYENEISNLGDWGWNDLANSLRVEGRVTLYEHVGYGGSSIPFTSDTNLGSLGWARRASSLKLTQGSRVTLYWADNYASGGASISFVYPSYQPPDLTVSSTSTMNLEGVVKNWDCDAYNGAGWTGAKFDVFAVENRQSHTAKILMLEMYFIRGGANLIWGSEQFRYLGGNGYNYLVALDTFANFVDAKVYPGGVVKWRINVRAFIQRACDHWSGQLNINNLKVVKISYALESAWNADFINPKVLCSLTRLRLGYT